MGRPKGSANKTTSLKKYKEKTGITDEALLEHFYNCSSSKAYADKLCLPRGLFRTTLTNHYKELSASYKDIKRLKALKQKEEEKVYKKEISKVKRKYKTRMKQKENIHAIGKENFTMSHFDITLKRQIKACALIKGLRVSNLVGEAITQYLEREHFVLY